MMGLLLIDADYFGHEPQSGFNGRAREQLIKNCINVMISPFIASSWGVMIATVERQRVKVRE